ncbi:hypothetical protein GCM10010124_01200 [Pilimelia terevasa]|uniref:PNPLA domain-containing protein n=1 Tax=Pilimelia terevasa TaxID=53372 RepID=A0A8J3BIE3_9ACTN|nr:patatin-like phospholipase family protein [Pilimelia terevasa]GGK12439.1 hypothetical protein GCM10010124_01200 [Pilimelia terevasa]
MARPAPDAAPDPAGTAVVLGAGGVTGIAWSVGVATGLAEAGVDLRAADLFVGTSAGAFVGAYLTSDIPLREWYARQLAPEPGPAPPVTPRVVAAARFGVLAWTLLTSGTSRRFGARLGALARRARTVSERDRLAVLGRSLPAAWPDPRLRVTAVAADTGEFAVFGPDSGVPLVAAVAASSAVPTVFPPTTLRGRPYLDGGVRSPANADLAAGYPRVVVLAPLRWGFGVLAAPARQVRALRERGAAVTLVTPDRAARAAFGGNSLDTRGRAPAARAGRRQGLAAAARVGPL